MNILIADDEYYARKALAQIILDWDASIHVIEAQNGQETMSVLEQIQIDIVFTDIRMPILDGLQLSALLFKQYPHITIVIVSGYDDFKYAQEAIVYNVKKYLLKPLDKQEVYPILEQAKSKFNAQTTRHMLDKINLSFHEQANIVPEDIGLLFFDSLMTVIIRSLKNIEFTLLSELVSEILTGYPFIHFHLEEQRYSNMSSVLIIAPNLQATEKLWVASSLFRQVHNKYVIRTGDSLTIGLSRIHQKLPSLHQSYQEAKSAVL